MRTHVHVVLVTFAILVGAGMPLGCSAQVSLPPVNLGITNFEDGFGRPGWFLQEFPVYYDANEFRNANGHVVPAPSGITTFSSTTHVAYVTHQPLAGGLLAWEILQPWADVDVDLPGGVTFSDRGLGDTTLGAGVQWAPMKLGRGVFVHRFILDVSVPTGRYSDQRSVNVGSNVVSVDPYYAFTYEVDKWEVSARLHYLWNFVNHDPFVLTGLDSVQPGQAFHVNLASSYEVRPGLRIGLNGYWLQQITDHQANGKDIADSRERTIGLGAGLQWFSGRTTWLHLNAYREFDVRNRAQGTSVILRISKAIPSAGAEP